MIVIASAANTPHFHSIIGSVFIYFNQAIILELKATTEIFEFLPAFAAYLPLPARLVDN